MSMTDQEESANFIVLHLCTVSTFVSPSLVNACEERYSEECYSEKRDDVGDLLDVLEEDAAADAKGRRSLSKSTSLLED